MTIQTDLQGQLYLSSDLRKQYGERFHVVEYEDRLELIPIDDDPLQAVRDELGGAARRRVDRGTAGAGAPASKTGSRRGPGASETRSEGHA